MFIGHRKNALRVFCSITNFICAKTTALTYILHTQP
jgi:hypothetical protein